MRAPIAWAVGRRHAASVLLLLTLLLLLAGCVLASALCRADLRSFVVAALERAQLESDRAAARIQLVLPELLERRIPGTNRREDSQVLLEVLGVQPASIDTLTLRIGESTPIVPVGWRTVAAAINTESCAASKHGDWWLRHVLLLDVCVEIDRVAREQPKSNGRIQGAQLVVTHALSTVERSNAALLVTTCSLVGILNRWQPHSDVFLLALVTQSASLASMLVLVWLLILRRLQQMRQSIHAAMRSEALCVPTRVSKRLDEAGLLEHTVRKLLRGAALQQRRLQRKNEVLERLRRFIAHEIRTPLQSLMAMNADSPPALSYLRRIKYAVDEVLEDAAQEDTRDIDEKELSAFVGRWVESLRTYRGEQMLVFSKPEMPCVVRINFEALEDALDHIYSNARDFRSEGSHIEVRVGCNPPHGTITVRNLGPRIAEHMLPLIFSYGVTTRGHLPQHLGQGLFRANSLVARMNGSLRAQNVPDGVEFTISLPLQGPVTL